jgi:hypothetical protein
MLKKQVKGFKTVEEIMELLNSERCTRYFNIFLYSTKDVKRQDILGYTSPYLYYNCTTSQATQTMMQYKDYQVQFIEPALYDDELVTTTYRIYIYY